MNKKTILITGAASGIGRETALFFAQNGWFTGIFDVNEEGLKTLDKEIGTGNCFSGIMNVAAPDSVRQGVTSLMSETGGRLDVLLNNAGILDFGLFETVPLERHHRVVDVNVKGILNMVYFCLPYLKKTSGARIINLSSISSLYGVPELGVYSATKHTVTGITEFLDIELEPYGIKVCDIRPPYVNTPMLDGGEEKKSMKALKLMGGFGYIKPEIVVKTIWKAAHKNRRHWNIGLTKLMVLQFWAAPYSKRFGMKFLAMPKLNH